MSLLNVDPRVKTPMVSDCLDAVGVRNNVMNISVRALRPNYRAVGLAATIESVSYTHLTLPTKA